jgi:hypothetical protein
MRSVTAQPIPASSAHFRSLRATPALSRDQALAFAELGLEVLAAVEDYVELPEVALPTLRSDRRETPEELADAAAEARQALGVADGPVPHVVRLLEAHGVFVLRLPDELVDRRVDALSSAVGRRPVVLLSPMKDDRARSRPRRGRADVDDPGCGGQALATAVEPPQFLRFAPQRIRRVASAEGWVM